jgi:hypothetical protein
MQPLDSINKFTEYHPRVSSSDRESLISFIQLAKELAESEKDGLKPQPNIKDGIAEIDHIIWEQSSVPDSYRQLRQSFLLQVGKMIDPLAQKAQLTYPREFLGEIIRGHQSLKNLGFTPSSIQHYDHYYRPWSEDILFFYEIGLSISQTMPELTAVLLKSSSQARAKLEKGAQLMEAFQALHQLLLTRDPRSIAIDYSFQTDEDLQKALLSFDQAWWEYLYLYYDPISGTKETRMAEISKRVSEYLMSMQAIWERILSKDEQVDREVGELAEQLTSIIQPLMPTINEKGEIVTEKHSPFVESVGSKMQELWKDVENSNQSIEQKEIVESHPVQTEAIVAEEQAEVIADQFVQSLLPITETPVDYSSYRGRIADFIRDHFDIVFKGDQVNEEQLEQVTEFYITDIHNSIGHRVLYTTFVNLFATVKSQVFVEGVEALKTCAAKDAFHSSCMNTFARIVGWDLDLDRISEDSKQMAQTELEFAYLSYQILNANLSLEERREIIKKWLSIFIKTWKVSTDSSDFFKTIEKINLLADQILPETFPARTQAMIHSVGQGTPQADLNVIIAGEAHLIRNETKYKDDERFSLDKFYQFLKPRNALILKPKQDKLNEAAAPYLAFRTRATAAWIQHHFK